MIYPFVASTSALFLVGLLFGYFVLAKFLIIALSPFFVATQITPLLPRYIDKRRRIGEADAQRPPTHSAEAYGVDYGRPFEPS